LIAGNASTARIERLRAFWNFSPTTNERCGSAQRPTKSPAEAPVRQPDLGPIEILPKKAQRRRAERAAAQGAVSPCFIHGRRSCSSCPLRTLVPQLRSKLGPLAIGAHLRRATRVPAMDGDLLAPASRPGGIDGGLRTNRKLSVATLGLVAAAG